MTRTQIRLMTAGLITIGLLLNAGCGESNCPLTTTSFAHFDFLDEDTHQAIKFTQPFDVTGHTVADITVNDTLTDGTITQRVVKDSLLSQTLYNKAESSLSLPLSFQEKTTYVLHYTERMKDTITLIHRTIPYLENVECGTMMFYHIEDVKYTTHNLRTIETVNPDIDNEEKKNLNIYYRADLPE